MSTPWIAWAKHKGGVPDRLGRYAILGHSEGRGKPVIADNIRTKSDAWKMAAADDMLIALDALLHFEIGHVGSNAGQAVVLARAAIAKARGGE